MLAIYGLLICLSLFAVYWLIQYRIGNSAIVDVFWAASVAVVGVYFCLMTSGNVSRRWIAGILVVLWAARLSYYLYFRWIAHEEDARYTALKVTWGCAGAVANVPVLPNAGIGSVPVCTSLPGSRGE